MGAWIKARAAERSTKAGLAVIAAIASHYAGPEALQNAGPVIAAFIGLVQVITSEQA